MLQGSLDKAVAQGNEAMKQAKDLELKLAEVSQNQNVAPKSYLIVIISLLALVAILLFLLLK